MKQAKVFLNNVLAGILTEDDLGYEFRYNFDYLKSNVAVAVSLTLPLTDKPYRDNVLFPFFDGLIPEGWLLDIAEQSWRISVRDRFIPMTMEDWAKRIDKFLDLTDRPVLTDAGHVSAEQAKEYAETEFEKYRVIQDKLFQSDFDRFNDDNLLPLYIE